ncbi:MAG TPA: hypothetical protein VHS96_09670, partial [Bacteroidia bacterium]|nr:hypothetical protein [Bacteroidia bacterium]
MGKLKPWVRWGFLGLALAMLAACGRPHPWYGRGYDHHQLESPAPALPDAPGSFSLFLIGDCGKSS